MSFLLEYCCNINLCAWNACSDSLYSVLNQNSVKNFLFDVFIKLIKLTHGLLSIFLANNLLLNSVIESSRFFSYKFDWWKEGRF